MTYKFNRQDANQSSIIVALQQIGCTVDVVDRRPYDLVVGRHGENYLLEVKDGSKPPSERKLKPSQMEFKKTWAGQWAVVYSVNDALRAVTGQVL